MQIEEVDFLVLGSGEAGKYLAWAMARQGMRVVIIERLYIGGSCPNTACLPSKNVIHSAKVASYFARSEEFGVEQASYKVDMSKIRLRKGKMVDGLIEMHLAQFKDSGAELLMGNGRFIAPRTIQVKLANGGTRVLRGKKVVICTGSRATIDRTPGLSNAKPLTHIEALELDHVPEHLVVIGGGYVGLELAQAMRRFGSRVTIIERNTRLAHNEDEDVSELLQDVCRQEGIDILTDVRLVSVEGMSGKSVKLNLLHNKSQMVVNATHIIVATGRTPNTNDIGLEMTGVDVTDRGHVKVNERLETTAADVWAVGDCAGSPHFTHIAYDDYRIIRDNLNGGNRVTTGRQVPFCMFTDPELARIGLSETEAKIQGIKYRLSKIPIVSVLRTRTVSETQGFMKALIATDSDRILGFTAIGINAGEVMATVQLAMLADMPYTELGNAIFTHPTMTEGLTVLFSKTPVWAMQEVRALTK